MSNTPVSTTAPTSSPGARPAPKSRPQRGRRAPTAPTLLRVLVVLIVAVLPLYLSSSLLQTGLFCMAAIIGAIGLNLLSGNTGQVSLAHAFFLAAGAYGYAFFAGKPSKVGGGISASGLQLPTVVVAILAVLLAGLLGLLFSPISSRLRGIYLAIASLALVFIGQHILFNAETITGGFNGRNVPTFNLFGFVFDTTDPSVYIMGVGFGKFERLWYLGLALVVLSYIFAKNLLRGRPGWAMQMVRDSEIAAAVMGVNVRRYKASAFVLSSMYAGLAGVLFALTFSRIVPDTFGFDLSVQFLAMIVIGGIGTVGGSALGAILVVGPTPNPLPIRGQHPPPRPTRIRRCRRRQLRQIRLRRRHHRLPPLRIRRTRRHRRPPRHTPAPHPPTTHTTQPLNLRY